VGEYEKEPGKFRENYKKVMEAGGTIGVSELWDTLLGNGKAEQKEFFEKRVEEIATHLEELRTKLEAMPDLPKKSQSKPVIGDFTASEVNRKGIGARRL
jgi:hypothetical protein